MRSVLCALFIVLLACVDMAHGQCPNGRCAPRVVIGPLGGVNVPAGYRVERTRRWWGGVRVNVSPGR
jgi:hypothetical protein